MQRGRGRIEVGNARGHAIAHTVVIGEAENLADLPGCHLEGRRREDKLAGGGPAEMRNVENAQGCAGRVDEGLVDRVDAGRQSLIEIGNDRARKTGDRHRTGIDDLGFLRLRHAAEKEAGGQRQGENSAACRDCAAQPAATGTQERAANARH
jgi:hypothetical protein